MIIDGIQLILDAKFASSKSEAKRLIEQGGIKINGVKVKFDEEIEVEKKFLLQKGKRNFIRIIINNPYSHIERKT